MKKGLVAVVVVAFMLLVPSAMLFAQVEKTAGATETKEVKHQKMTLTDEQRAKIKEIRTSQRLKVIDAKAALEKNQIVLRQEIAKDQPSMTEIDATLRKIADARLAIQKARIEGALEVRKVLGPEWKAMMKECRMGDDPAEATETEMEGDSEEADPAAMGDMDPGMGCPMGMDMGDGKRTVVVLRGSGDRMGMRARGMRGWRMTERPGFSMREGGMMMGCGGDCMMGGCCMSKGMDGRCCCMGKGMGGNMMYRHECMGKSKMSHKMIMRKPGGMGMGGGCCMMMQKGGMGGGCPMSGCMMMQKGGMGEGCPMSGCMMMQKGGMGAGSPMSGCMMHKGEGGAKEMSGCMMKAGGAGGACTKAKGAAGTCAGESGWKNKGAYRPHTWGMSGGSCTGKCTQEMKVKLEKSL